MIHSLLLVAALDASPPPPLPTVPPTDAADAQARPLDAPPPSSVAPRSTDSAAATTTVPTKRVAFFFGPTLGVGTSLGYLGSEFVYAPAAHTHLAFGVGIASQGTHVALSGHQYFELRSDRADLRNQLGFGVGLSSGAYYDEFAISRAPTEARRYWKHAMFLNLEAELRLVRASQGSVGVFLGLCNVLNPRGFAGARATNSAAIPVSLSFGMRALFPAL